MIQATLIQIDNYGPWTTHPQPRREAELQILQANIYAELQKLFSEKKALLFPMRCDNMLAVTNGLTEEDHKNIIKSFNGKHPVTISMAVATAETPLEAQKRATEELVKEGGAKHSHRKGVLKFTEGTKDKVRIAHIDINSITQHTDKDVYESYAKVIGTQNELMTHLAGENALLFFMGGDNFISVCNGLTKEKLETIFQLIYKETYTDLKAGMGTADTAQDATHLASMGLKEIRAGKTRERIVVKEA